MKRTSSRSRRNSAGATEDNSVLRLSKRGQEQIVDLLLNPQDPNAKLQALFDRFKDVDRDEAP
jgi:uncharacterized protein (DUF1778 family)